MSENLGTDVSYVDESVGYNYDKVVFQKEKPPLDTELNLTQEIQTLLARRHLKSLASGWLSMRPFYTSSLLENQFYTQDPAVAIPEFAVVNGMVLYVTNTATTETNSNKITLTDPPLTGNIVNGVFLEVWRALLNTEDDDNRPDSAVVIDSIMDLDAVTENSAWVVGENGLILTTENGGLTWGVQLINTKRTLNSVHFINTTVGWIAGDNGVIARTSSSGQNWLVLQSGYTENLNGIHAATQLIAWVVGDSGLILKTTNGVNWIAQSSGVTVNLNNVYFYNNLVGWAVGDTGTILRTTNGGSSWIKLSSGTTQNLNAVYFYDLNFGFAVGDNGTILRTSDGGLSWVNQSSNIYTGSGYTSLTVNYTDVTMAPSLDEYVNGEEITSQFSGSNKNGTVVHVPITKGDGLGTTTNLPADITVTVNGTTVLVDSVDGATGQIVLHEAPAVCDTVKVFYWYRISPEIFKGKAWVSGASGTVLVTSDIGANWIQQTSNTGYDLNAVSFVDQYKGWLAGAFSVIRHTEDSGTTWAEQKSDAITRRVQRVYYEGNVGSNTYLTDEMIHPDTNIETTKRVQIQYKIRVVTNVDPYTYPDAGLGSGAIVALGPNTSGTFAYENMGASTGDYGVWQAKCNNTIDGYCWAIPMFFVSRRNSTAYSAATNPNGSNVKNTANIRPDLLIGTDVVDRDILDVRRKVIIPSVTELLNKNFDLLMNNQLKTRLFRQTTGGDRYSTEPLQLDYISNGSGTLIDGTLSDAVLGNISSQAELGVEPLSVPAGTSVPGPVTISLPSGVSRGLFHPNLLYYSARYDSPGSQYDGKPVPGKFSGIGTTQITFTFSSKANTTNEDIQLSYYVISAYYVSFSNSSLTEIPSSPQIVKNTRGTDPSFYYWGVLSRSTSGRRIEEWDSDIPGYLSYALAYPVIGGESTVQEARASNVEIHEYFQLTTTEIVSTNQIAIPKTVYPDTSDVPYNIYSVSKINNITSGFSYKIENIVVTDKVYITSVSGFPFVVGTIIEVVSCVWSLKGDANVRNGACVNFIQNQKKISPFCYSAILEKQNTSPTSITFTSLDIQAGQIATAGGIFLGISTTETVTSLTDSFAWVDTGSGDVLTSVTVTEFNNSTITITFPSPIALGSTISIQALIKQASLIYNTDSTDGLQIAYYYIPSQTPLNLPSSLVVEIITNPTNIYVSNLGTGGSVFEKEPYDFPLVSIPLNDALILDDNEFYNLDLFRFPNFSVNGGFVQVPVLVPGSFGEELTFSNLGIDNILRTYYSTCDREFVFNAEGLRIAIPRKIFIAMIGRVKESSTPLLKGEYVLIIVSRNELMELDNYTGYKASSKSVLAVFRLPNKPLARE